ncbi:MAG: phosphoglycerate dehydrogenase [bacterium]
MAKILVTDPISEEGIKILKSDKNLEIDVKLKLPPEEIKKIIGAYEGLVVRSGTKVTKDIISAADNLRFIGRAGVGVDNVDVEAATKKGIVVMNTPGGNTISAAEHTIALLLSMSRNIPIANASLKSKQWERKKFTGTEVYKKTLAVIGLGRIGREVAKRAQGLGMQVIGYDPVLSVDKAKNLNITLMSVQELLPQADYISLHIPLTSETKYLLGAKEFDLMKKGVRVINCARGGVVDEKALCEAVKSGKVAGAALDVFEEEPPFDSPVLSFPQILVTPHLGASTEEAQLNVAIQIAEQMLDAFNGKMIRNAVNIHTLEPEILNKLKFHIDLAEKIGKFISQINEGHIEEVYVEYSGEITCYDLTPITLSVLIGLLKPMLSETINLVNAPVIAQERGIKIVESKSSEETSFTNLVSVKVTTDKRTMKVAGSLISQNEPRLVSIDGFMIDAVFSKYMFVCFNIDKPGIIGKIGTILGEKAINIAGMRYARTQNGGQAIAVFNVDENIHELVLKKIEQVEGITKIKLVVL